MIIKKTLSLAASIINLIILKLLFFTNCNALENNSKYFSNDSGILSLMYHRFNENKYPSTNIRMDIFKEQMSLIKELGYEFYSPKLFLEEFKKPKSNKKILITIDDGFKSFYNEAWPYLKKNKIPFILFVSTEPVGSTGYMNWEQIKEIENSGHIIGLHSNSHPMKIDDLDILEQKEEYQKNVNHLRSILNQDIISMSHPCGNYDSNTLKILQDLGIKIGFRSNTSIESIKSNLEIPREDHANILKVIQK